MEPEDNGAPSGATPLVEKPAEALTAIRPEFIASFLSLDVSFVTNLPPAVIQKISARANEFEALKSQRLLDEVSFGMSNQLRVFNCVYLTRTIDPCGQWKGPAIGS